MDANSYEDALVLLATEAVADDWGGPLSYVETVVRGLAFLTIGGRPDADWMGDVVALFQAVPLAHRYRVFWLLDEHPARWGWKRECPYSGAEREWHYKLRRVRNAPTVGTRLFDVLGGAND